MGELVVYGGEGVCRVKEIGKPNIRGVTCEYYTLLPLYRSGQVLTPVDTKVLMRPILTAQQVEELISALPELETEPLRGHVRTVKEYYQSVIASYDCWQLARLIKLLEQKRQEAVRQKKKISQLDEHYLRRAEELLYGELAATLNLPREDISAYLQEKCPRWEENPIT